MKDWKNIKCSSPVFTVNRRRTKNDSFIAHAKISIIGNEGIFKSLEILPISDSNNRQRMYFDI